MRRPEIDLPSAIAIGRRERERLALLDAHRCTRPNPGGGYCGEPAIARYRHALNGAAARCPEHDAQLRPLELQGWERVEVSP